jgi:hypothetical protein
MAEKIRLVQGDTGPQVRLTFTDETSGDPTDLTGATGTLYVRLVGSTTVVITRALYINPATAASGVAYIVWGAGDLNQDPGDYEGEVEITFSNSNIETIYEIIDFQVRDDF